LPVFDPSKILAENPGIWKYRHTFGLPDAQKDVSLGEGNTPLVWANAFGREIALKCEYLNPTGSFKDRGSAVLTGFLCSMGVQEAIEDSSGNAGASFAAYAARAGISARIFVPDSASGPKRKQIAMYGANLVRIMGPRSNAAEAALHAADKGAVYGSHAYLPFNIPGYATLAYELVEQLGRAPGTVVVPVGQGGLFLGLLRGFMNLVKGGVIERIPKLIGVQALACAPLWTLFAYGSVAFGLSGEVPTVAEGIRVRYPVRGDVIMRLSAAYGLEFIAVDEEKIIAGRDRLAQLGFYIEPTSAVVWDALEQGISGWNDPVVAILTGSGLKTFI
jgi:threonine synthase